MTDQREFRAGLLDAHVPVPPGLVDGHGRPAGRRYAVYRNNVTVSLIEAMKTAFPFVRDLIGPQGFDTLVPRFVRAHPPTSPLMMYYGADFPAFLDSVEQLAHIGYLADAARLDLAMRQSYHAADGPQFTPDILNELSPEQLMESVWTLAPATRILRSPWPLHDIWRFSLDKDASKPRAMAQDVLITRPEYDPAPHLLPQGAAHLLEALAQGKPLGHAVDIATDACPAFDLGESLTVMLQSQAISTIAHKDMK